jgi:hypothetical protein
METITLTESEQRLLAQNLMKAIDNYCVQLYSEGHRHHLGASVIGDDCAARVWFGFRWVLTEQYIDHKTGQDITAQRKRLFNRGHKEEARFIEWLRGAGVIVDEFQADGKTQFRISGCSGHFGGSLDGKGIFPKELIGKELPHMLLEFKTSSSKYFPDLKEKGVKINKVRHYRQMCLYGKHYGLKYACYFCVNKDTDEIYIEVIELDWKVAEELELAAAMIINSPTVPKKISENSSYYECRYLCAYKNICHKKAAVEVNCRSCKFAVPSSEGKWFCTHFNGIIPKDFLPKGCQNHVGVVNV